MLFEDLFDQGSANTVHHVPGQLDTLHQMNSELIDVVLHCVACRGRPRLEVFRLKPTAPSYSESSCSDG